MSRTILLAGASIACAAFASSACAQTAGNTRLEDIDVFGTGAAGALTAPSLKETRRELDRTPGAVAVLDAEAYKGSTPAATLKDVLDFTPGVFAQTKWGEDTRLSIRGSGLSRNFHLRGVQLYMDGVPVSTADGYGDFQEIDPSAYRLVEVYKGANALRFGANALGGAINFVTPSGRDELASAAQGALDFGAFGFARAQASTSGATDRADWFVTGSAQRAEGFRDHSNGDAERMSANLGYRFSDDVETRFYLNANTIDQNIPGSVTRDAALHDPKRAAAANLIQDYERNIDTARFANKTTVRVGETTSAEFGVFAADRHLMHPIFQWLDYRYLDYGGFARITDEREVAGRANRLVAGVNLHAGVNDAKQYENPFGGKGAQTFEATQTSSNVSLYAENTHYVAPTLGLVTAIQFLHAKRKQDGQLGAGSGSSDHDLASPKLGVIWDIEPKWQAFANLSKSVEVPSYGENSFAIPNATLAKPQKAWTAELGTRGRREDVTWDAAVYRAHIKNELFCSAAPAFPGFCTVVNFDETVHQGVELAFGAAVLKGLAVDGDRPDKVWINLAYTFSDFRFDDDAAFGDNALPGAPRHYLRAEAFYKHPSGFFAGPNLEWVPEAYYVDSANTAKTKAYALLGAKLGYDAGGPLSAYVEARNIADKKYIASVNVTDDASGGDFELYEPGSGRALYAGVKYRW